MSVGGQLRRIGLLCGASAILYCAAIGCEYAGGGAKDNVACTVRQVARDIEPLARASEEWGTISISSPLLVNRGPEHRFKLSHNADEYFRMARSDINANVFASRQQAIDTQFGLKLTANIDEVLASLAALDKYAFELGEFNRQQRTQRRQAAFGDIADSIRSVQPLLGLGAGASQAEILAAILGALDQQGPPSSAPSNGPTYPTFPTLVTTTQPVLDADVLPTTRPAQAPLSSVQFTQPFALGGTSASQPSATPLNDAVLEAHSAHSIATILNLLSDTDRARFKNKRVLVGVAMVSVNPGWRTYRNYAAELTVDVSYQDPAQASKQLAATKSSAVVEFQRFTAERANAIPESKRAQVFERVDRMAEAGQFDLALGEFAEELGNNQNKDELISDWNSVRSRGVAEQGVGGGTIGGSSRLAPLVAAVSPLTQSQNLDLKSSIREQIAAALKISAALRGLGAQAQAQQFVDFVNRLEQDAASRTVLNTVVARSHAGGKFGYRISPSFRALKAPGTKDATPGMLLEPQTFPVLVVFGIDTIDRHRLGLGDRTVQLLLNQTLQWMPIGNPDKDDALLGLGFLLRDRTRVSEADRMEWAIAASRAHSALDGLSAIKGSEKALKSYARLRTEALESQTLATSSWQDIPDEIWSDPPKPTTPTVASMSPREIDANGLAEVEVLLAGANLSRCDVNTIRPVISPRKPETRVIVTGFSVDPGGNSATLRFRAEQVFDQSPSLIYFELRPREVAESVVTAISPPLILRTTGGDQNKKIEFSVDYPAGHTRCVSYDPRINFEVIKAYLQSLSSNNSNATDNSVNVKIEAKHEK